MLHNLTKGLLIVCQSFARDLEVLMKAIASFRASWKLVSTSKVVPILVSTLMLTTLLLAACAPDASSFIITPRLSQQIAARDAGQVVTALVEVKRKLAELLPEEIYVGLPPEIADQLATADIASVEAIRSKYACAGCHSDVKDTQNKVGPSWYNLGNEAVEREDGVSPALYLYESIVEPRAFIVEGYESNSQAMPANFIEQMSEAEIATVVKFILTQTQE